MTSNTKNVGDLFQKAQFANQTVFSSDKDSVLRAPTGEMVKEEGEKKKTKKTTDTQFKCFDSLVKESELPQAFASFNPALTASILSCTI